MRPGRRARRAAFALAALGLAAPDAWAADVRPRLSLAAAVGQALTANPRLLDARDTVEQANVSLRLARSDFRPKVVPNIVGSFGQTDVSNQMYRVDMSQRFTTGTELRATVGTATFQNQLGDYYNTDTTFLLSQPLLRGAGRAATRGQLASAEARLADAEQQRVISEYQVTLDVARAYYRIVAQQRVAEVAEKSLDRARRLREASQAKLQVGKVSQLDVFRAQQLVGQGEVQLLDAQAAVEEAKDYLRFLMGRDVDYDFDVEQEIPREVEPVAAEQAVMLAGEHRLELSGARAAVAEADRQVALARNRLLPQLDLSLGVTRRETAEGFLSSFRLDRFRMATFFTISMPVNRSQDNLAYHNALLERDRRRRETVTLGTRLAHEARGAVRQQERILKSLQLADSNVEFARQELEVAELRYQRGLSNNLDVVSAEAGLLGAESRRIALLAELAVARLVLRATLGVLDPVRDIGPEAAVS
jgi:outer membrane protein